MRQAINPQKPLGAQSISAIQFDPKSRDDIPQILRSLQYIYTTPELRERVFALRAGVIPASTREGRKGATDASTGRPGMDQWKILVLGTLRLGLNADFGRIHEPANQHNTLRQMLGRATGPTIPKYNLQTLKDDLHLFTPELLDRINQEVVRAGHQLLWQTPLVGTEHAL